MLRMMNDDRSTTIARTRGARAPVARFGQPAFSFTEVMFAVVILGVGFIMVAAMFPVAIHQSQTTNDENTGSHISRGATNVVRQIAASSIFPTTKQPGNGY